MKRWILPLLLLLLVVGYMSSNRPVAHGPGVVAPDEPWQEGTSAAPFDFNGFRITPLADFEIEARALSKKSYSNGTEAKLSPWDIAFGWGPMSDEAILDEIDISQSGRFYYWRVKEFPIPRKEIERNSANMHLIPASDEVEDVLDGIRVGQVVLLTGQLVSIEGPGNWRWKSSLTRNDTGHGACEVIYVTEVSITKGY
jgi:hypothetical protein